MFTIAIGAICLFSARGLAVRDRQGALALPHECDIGIAPRCDYRNHCRGILALAQGG